jgi:hypothetical protein
LCNFKKSFIISFGKLRIMKRILLLFLIAGSCWLTGCETTREISLNQDNSGTLMTTMDMSGLLGMAKMSGQSKELDKLNDEVVDTTISLDAAADSIRDLTSEERALIRKGKLSLHMNAADEKLIVKTEFLFSNAGQIVRLDQLSSRLMQQTFKKLASHNEEDSALGLSGTDIPTGSIDDYFSTTYSKNSIEKKLNKEKYATVGNDEGMKALKEMSAMGIGNTTLIINLPRPVKKTEGKNIKLSDDKKKITITSSAEDFFDDGAALEFKIEY